jgi:N-acetylglucosaminyldiphosphoundecaprenol N-acetyl-beta-D-mannosaminyltransferase
MANWLIPNHRSASDAVAYFDERADRQLRAFDLLLSLLLLPLVALPLVLGLLLGRTRATWYEGRAGERFKHWQIDFPATLAGRILRRTGVGSWLVLFNILRGEMAWVGPQAKPGLARIRPGLVNIWELRRRTAVDFGSELDADLEYAAQRGLKHDLGLLLRALLLLWLPRPGETSQARLCVGDVSFDNVNMTEALERIGDMLKGNSAQQVSFVNPACVNIAAGDRGYRRLLGRAALVLPDGIGIKIAAGILGVPLKQNVNGTDLFPRLCEMLQARGASVFLLGGRPGIAEQVAAVIHEGWPQLRIAGMRDGYFETAQEGEVAAQVTASQADVLLVARGVPMQDVFIDRHLHQLGVKAAIGVGGLFDFVSGRINRAPTWMRDSGLEWIYRLLQEPSRMWRRYLVGNFSFLGRIALQRLGLRRPANDELKQLGQLLGAGLGGIAGLRTVLFATATAPPDVPVGDDFPAALLPLGCKTFIEHALEQLSNAGVRQIDLVVSSRPEEVRRLLGNGERWGVQLRWHLVKESGTPYGVLTSLGLEQAQRILLGHADRWISDGALAALLQRDQVLTLANEGVKWAGWGCATQRMLEAISPFSNEAALGSVMCNMAAELLVLESDQFIAVHSAKQLLQAQQIALTGEFMEQVPATWLRAPWGAYSPDAVVQAGALIEGPVLIGPGCLVASGARIGPLTLLTSDSVISTDSTVRHSVVLPHTYVGEGLELDEAIVKGRSVQHLRLGVRTVLPTSEGLLLDLKPNHRIATSWYAMLVAGVVCAALFPWLVVDAALRRSTPRWNRRLVVSGQDAESGQLRLQSLRCPNSTERGASHFLAHYGALLDIAAGHRSWFGARPRSQSEWYALSRDWQLLLANTPVGCLHAPAWDRGEAESREARAAADVFYAVSQSLSLRLRILAGMLRGLATTTVNVAGVP